MSEMNLGQQIAEAFWVTVSIISLIGLWFYLDTPAVEGEPTRWRRLCAWFSERYLAPKVSGFYDVSDDASNAARKHYYDKQERERAGIKPSDTSINIGIAPFDAKAVPSDLTYEEVVAILAGLKTPAGKDRYSGKKIYTLVGGNYNEFTVLMRRLRAKDNEPAEEPDILTPIAGRPTKASYFSERDLVYEPPER